MNAKQRIIVLIFGIALAAVCVWQGHKRRDWFYKYFVSTALVGGVAYIAAGDSPSEKKSSRPILGAAIALAILVQLHHARSTDDVVGSLTDVEFAVDAIKRTTDDLETAVDELQSTLGNIESTVQNVENDVQGLR